MRGGSLLLLSFIALAVSLSEQQELGRGGGGGDDGGIRQRPRMPDLSRVRAAREARGTVPEDVGETEEKKISEGYGDGDGGGGGRNVAPIASRAVAALLAKTSDAAEETSAVHGEGKVAGSAEDDRGHQDAAAGERDVTTGENTSERVAHEGGTDYDEDSAAAPEVLTSQEESDERRSHDAGHEGVGSEGEVGDGGGKDADGGEIVGSVGDAGAARQGNPYSGDGRGGYGDVGGEEREGGAEDEACRASAAACISQDVAPLTGGGAEDADAAGGKEGGRGESVVGEGSNDIVESNGTGVGGADENVKEENVKEEEEEEEEEREEREEREGKEKKDEEEKEKEEKDGGIGVDVPLRTSSGEGGGPRACPVTHPTATPQSPSSPSQAARPRPAPPLLKDPSLSLRDAPSAPARDETKRRNVQRGAGMLASSLHPKEGAKLRFSGNRRNLGTSPWSPLPPYEAPRKERMERGGGGLACPRPELGVGGILRVQAASCVSYGIYYLMFEACAKWMAASARGRCDSSSYSCSSISSWMAVSSLWLGVLCLYYDSCRCHRCVRGWQHKVFWRVSNPKTSLPTRRVKATGPIMAAFAMSVPIHHVLLRIATHGAAVLDGPSSLLSGFGRTASMCLLGLAASPMIEHMVKMAGVVEDATLLTWVSSGVWAAYHTLIVSRSL
jgi:hypothetical protein